MKQASWIAIAALFAAGCSSGPPATLTGEYFTEINGSRVNVARITQDASGYGMQWFSEGSWIPVTGPVTALSKEELGKLVTGPVDNLIGLKSKEETILGVPKGWTQIYVGHQGAKNVEFKSATGYVWISPLGLIDLTKQ